MGLRFRKSISLGKGFRINLSKSGVGASWGVKGFRLTQTAKGKTRATVGLPGTGLSYSTELGGKKKSKKAADRQDDRPIGEEIEDTEEIREEEREEGITLLEILLTVVLWLLTAFYGVLAAANIPETVGFVALGAALAMLPIGIWQSLLSNFLKGGMKVIVAIALAVATLFMSPFGALQKWIPQTEETAIVQEEAVGNQTPSAQMDYVLNVNSDKFHLPDCRTISSMSEKNRQDFRGTREELVEQGYYPCDTCKP